MNNPMNTRRAITSKLLGACGVLALLTVGVPVVIALACAIAWIALTTREEWPTHAPQGARF